MSILWHAITPVDSNMFISLCYVVVDQAIERAAGARAVLLQVRPARLSFLHCSTAATAGHYCAQIRSALTCSRLCTVQHFREEPEQHRYHDGMAREAREESVELTVSARNVEQLQLCIRWVRTNRRQGSSSDESRLNSAVEMDGGGGTVLAGTGGASLLVRLWM